MKGISDNDLSKKIRRMVLTGLFFACAVILSLIENTIPLPVPAPGVKFGLSNIVVMYALFFLGKKEAILLAFLKSLFVFITRGAIAGFLSLFGGLFSVLVMISLIFVFKDKISYLVVSIVGSIFHNIGQLIAVSLIYTNFLWIAYLPVLLIAGVLAGLATSTLLKVFIPAFKKVRFDID